MNFNRLIPELSVVDEVYERIKKAGIKLFREMQIEDYRCGDEVIHQKHT